MYSITGGAGGKCIITAAQGDGTVTYIHCSKMYIQKVTS